MHKELPENNSVTSEELLAKIIELLQEIEINSDYSTKNIGSHIEGMHPKYAIRDMLHYVATDIHEIKTEIRNMYPNLMKSIAACIILLITINITLIIKLN